MFLLIKVVLPSLITRLSWAMSAKGIQMTSFSLSLCFLDSFVGHPVRLKITYILDYAKDAVNPLIGILQSLITSNVLACIYMYTFF